MNDPSPSGLSPVACIVRRHDPDRFFTALFAPPARREALFVLYAVNHELARAREAVSNPMLALIRLQWWREVAEGARRRHEVAEPLGKMLDDGRLCAEDVLGMIDGREAEVDGIEDMAAFRSYVLAAYGGVAVAAGKALDVEEPGLDALRAYGAAYGVAGILRGVPVLARQERCLLPLDLLSQAKLTVADVVADPTGTRLETVRRSLAQMGTAFLKAGRAVRLLRPGLVAALPAVLARRDLRRAGYATPHGLADRIAIMAAAATGKV